MKVNTWKLIDSKNCYDEDVTVKDYIPPSFEKIKIGDLIKICPKIANFTFNPLIKLPFATRVEDYNSSIIFEKSKEYEGVVLENNTFFNSYTEKKEDFIKLMISYGDSSRFIFINSTSCWFGGLTLYLLDSES